MRYKELIKEVPISDIQPMGDPDPEIDQDYSDEDEGMYKAWSEPEKRDFLSPSAKAQKWRSGVVKSWSKTKNNYIIIPVFGEDAYNYENIEKGITPIDELKDDFEEGYRFLHQLEVLEDGYTSYEDVRRTEKHADKTIVFFLGNAAEDWVRASGWMLLHRLGHASRTTHKPEMQVNPAYSHALTLMFESLQDTFGNFGVDFWLKHDDNVNAKVPTRRATGRNTMNYQPGIEKWAVYALQKIMTMRAARAGKLRDSYEALYEMWAQYLNTGGVKFRVPKTFDFSASKREPDPKDEQELMPGDIQLIEGYLERFEEVMNEEAFPPLEESIAGEILLM